MSNLSRVVNSIMLVESKNDSFDKSRRFRLTWSYSRPETYPKSFAFKPLDPPKKRPFLGGGLYYQIFFSILEIRPWFKIWKTLKVSFGSIWNILVNTWSTPIDLMRNEIWGFWKKWKKGSLEWESFVQKKIYARMQMRLSLRGVTLYT